MDGKPMHRRNWRRYVLYSKATGCYQSLFTVFHFVYHRLRVNVGRFVYDAFPHKGIAGAESGSQRTADGIRSLAVIGIVQ